MEDRAAMKAAGASQQTVESSGTSHVPVVDADKPRDQMKKEWPATPVQLPAPDVAGTRSGICAPRQDRIAILPGASPDQQRSR